jgi:uncharacterized membrane protein HdeD (DUF308 family)
MVLPAMAVVGIVLLVSVPLALVVGALLIGAFILVSGALNAVVTTALYRYAMDGAVLGAFTAEDLEGAYRPKN